MKSCQVTQWWSGSAYIVVDGSVAMQFFSRPVECIRFACGCPDS